MDVEDDVPPPSKPKVVHPPDSPLADLQSAVEQWNSNHRRDLPKRHGQCPICSYKGGFGIDKDDATKWFCFNDDEHAVGKRHSDGWHGDMLDLEVHETGKDRISILRRDGYLPQICGATTKNGKTCHATELLADGRCSHHTSTKKEPNQAEKQQPASTLTITTPIADFLGDEDAIELPEEWLVESMLPPGVVAFLSGLPKCGKTWIGLHFAITIASGRKALGRYEVKQGPTLVITEEDTVPQVRKRIWWLARGIGVDPRTLPIRVSALRGFRIDEPGQLGALETEAKGAHLILLDALTRIHGLDENSRTDMQTVTHGLQQLAARTGATVLTIHHERKRSPMGGDGERAGQRMRGTGDLHALARAIISVDKAKDGTMAITTESNYSTDGEPIAAQLVIEPPVDIALKQGQKRTASITYVGKVAVVNAEAQDGLVLEALRHQLRPQSKTDLRALVGGNAKATDDAISRLARRNQIELVEAEKTDSRGRTVNFKGWRLVAT